MSLCAGNTYISPQEKRKSLREVSNILRTKGFGQSVAASIVGFVSTHEVNKKGYYIDTSECICTFLSTW